VLGSIGTRCGQFTGQLLDWRLPAREVVELAGSWSILPQGLCQAVVVVQHGNLFGQETELRQNDKLFVATGE